MGSGEVGWEDSKDKKNPDDFKHTWLSLNFKAGITLTFFNTINFFKALEF